MDRSSPGAAGTTVGPRSCRDSAGALPGRLGAPPEPLLASPTRRRGRGRTAQNTNRSRTKAASLPFKRRPLPVQGRDVGPRRRAVVIAQGGAPPRPEGRGRDSGRPSTEGGGGARGGVESVWRLGPDPRDAPPHARRDDHRAPRRPLGTERRARSILFTCTPFTVCHVFICVSVQMGSGGTGSEDQREESPLVTLVKKLQVPEYHVG